MIFLSTLVLGPNTLANVSKLSKEFLLSNIEVQNAKLRIDKSLHDYKIEDEKREWALNLSSEYANSTLRTSPSSYYSLDNKTLTHTLSLLKETKWGGRFRLSSGFVDGDYGSSGSSNSYDQNVSYEQDLGRNFLGRNYYLNINASLQRFKATESGEFSAVEQGLLSFLTTYLKTSYLKDVMELKNASLDRATKRTKYISKKVRDGLKERADLYSAKTQEAFAREELLRTTNEFEQSLGELSKKLQREISSNEITKISEELPQKSSLLRPIPKGRVKDNRVLLSSKMSVEAFKNILKQKENMILPKISLKTAYRTNNFDENSKDAFKDGTIGSKNKEYKVGLEISMPLSFDIEKYQKEKAKADFLIATNNLEKKKVEVASDLKLIKRQIDLATKNIHSSEVRVDLSRKTFLEYNKLYNRGKGSLDQVLNAESRYLETQESFLNYQVQRESYLYSLEYLYSSLIEKFNH